MVANRILIAGGSGVFGSLLAHELLATTEAHLVLAGRDPRALLRAWAPLGDRAEARVLDLRDTGAFAKAAHGCSIVICCAGPFDTLPRALPAIAAEAGAHWLDIADDRAWVLDLLGDAQADGAANAAGRAIIPGLSSVPLLAMVLLRRVTGARRAVVTLFIGNRNAKGAASIASALQTGFRDPVEVATPFGWRLAYRFDSPVEQLARDALGIEAEFRVALGSGVAGRVVQAASSVLGGGPVPRAAAHALSLLSRALPAVGESGGGVAVEASGTGPGAALALVGSEQRFAILPAAIAAALLLRQPWAGVIEGSAWLPSGLWLERLRERGLRLLVRTLPFPS